MEVILIVVAAFVAWTESKEIRKFFDYKQYKLFGKKLIILYLLLYSSNFMNIEITGF